jgi:hypothetical protein
MTGKTKDRMAIVTIAAREPGITEVRTAAGIIAAARDRTGMDREDRQETVIIVLAVQIADRAVRTAAATIVEARDRTAMPVDLIRIRISRTVVRGIADPVRDVPVSGAQSLQAAAWILAAHPRAARP